MEIPVLIWSLKSIILNSTSFQMGKTFWEVVSAAVEQSRRKANMVAQGDGKFGPWGWAQDPSKPKKYLRKQQVDGSDEVWAKKTKSKVVHKEAFFHRVFLKEILETASRAEFSFSLSNHVGFIPSWLCRYDSPSEEVYIHLNTLWALNDWLQWSHKNQ